MLIFDLETDGLLDTVSLISCVHMFDTERPEVGVQRFNDHEYLATGTVAEGVFALASATATMAHNGIGYDYQVLDKLYPEWNDVQKPKRLDSLVMSSVIYPDIKAADFTAHKKGYWTILGKNNKTPEKMGGVIGSHSLKAWGMRLGNLKDDYDPRTQCPEGLSIGEAWATVGWTKEMDDYCVQDVLSTVSLWELIESKQYSEQCLDLEHAFATIMQRQERRGFKLDVNAGEKLHQDLLVRSATLEEELQDVFPNWYEKDGKNAHRAPKVKNGPRGETAGAEFTKVTCRTFNPSSTDQIANRLQAVFGWKPEVFSQSGEVSCTDEVLATLSYECIPAIREYLMVSKRLGQLAHGTQAILRKVKDDGRIHGRVKTNGASTGRCTHSNPNVANTPSVNAPYGDRFRGLYTVDSGFKLVGADASGLELRCLGHYLARFDGGQYANEVVEGDVHWANLCAIGIASGPMDSANPKHKAARNAGKTWCYGYLYGAGESLSGVHYTAAHAAFNGIENPKPISGRKSRASFRDNTVGLADLEAAVKSAAKSKGWIKGLDGRQIPIRSEHSALNAALQSAGAVIMKQALVLLDDKLQSLGLVAGDHYEFVANVHDEFQIEVKDIGGMAQVVAIESTKAMTAAGKLLNLKVKIDGESKIGNNWAETH